MTVAILGWGSLIWRDTTLEGTLGKSDNDDKLQISSPWHEDGPSLPIEFARGSSGNRLTLVLVPDVPLQKVLWSVSSFDKFEEARENLRRREGDTVNLEAIHFLKAGIGEKLAPDSALAQTEQTHVRRWMSSHPDIDAVIWTGLGPKNSDGTIRKWGSNKGWGPNEALSYLKDNIDTTDVNPTPKQGGAREYVARTPPSIRTPLRTMIEEKLGDGWKPIPLDRRWTSPCPSHGR
jgi:hypothetical protein